MVAQVTGVTNPNTSEDTKDIAWRHMWAGRDGIRNDYDGGAFDIVVSSVAPTVTVKCAGRSILVDNNLITFATDVVLDPRDAGVMPTGDQTRLDHIAARYDSSVPILRDRGSLVIVPGAPALSPIPPPLSRTPADQSGPFDLVTGRFRLPSNGLLTGLTKRRVWSGDELVLEAAADLGSQYPIGTRAFRGDDEYLRVLSGGSTPGPVWRNLTDEAAQRLAADPAKLTEKFPGSTPPAGSLASAFGAPTRLVPLVNLPARPYRRVASVKAAAYATETSSDSATFEIGFRLYKDVGSGQKASDLERVAEGRRIRNLAPFQVQLEQEFTLDANLTYAVEFIGRATVEADRVRVSTDGRRTYMDVSTRGSA